MFACHACLRRAISNLLSDLPVTSRPQISLTSPLRRRHSTLQSITKVHHRNVLLTSLRSKNPLPRNTRRGRDVVTNAELRDAEARANNRRHLDIRPRHETEEEWRVQFLRDPLKLASAVLEKLRDDDWASALALVRASERTPTTTPPSTAVVPSDGSSSGSERRVVDNVVSWNHIIDWHIHKGQSRGALKIYNEMKKRGHRPDSHTFTILLRGFAADARRPNVVAEATSVYNSIFAPNSDVKPNTIHTNAMINVCAKAGNMDALWAVAGRLPVKGPGAPDKWTYTTILNALQSDAVSRAAKMNSMDQGDDAASRRIITQAIDDGKQLWDEVMVKWRWADIAMDEALVCAMGRLLLLSTDNNDWRAIFVLLQQTMGLKVGGLIKETHEEGEAGTASMEHVEEQRGAADNGDSASLSLTSPQASFAPFGSSAKPAASLTVANTQNSLVAVPGNNALSLALEASLLLDAGSTGRAYYRLLTAPHGSYRVVPDAQNLKVYLRLLRAARSSRLSADLVCSDYAEGVAKDFFKPGTFVLAMSACVRDKRSPHAFESANKILDRMQDRLDALWPKAVTSYIEVALATTPGWVRSRGSGERFIPHAEHNNTMRMVARLTPVIVEFKSHIKKIIAERHHDNLPSRAKMSKRPQHVSSSALGDKQHLDDHVTTLRTLIGAYDRLIDAGNDPARVALDQTLPGGEKSMGLKEWTDYVDDVKYQKRSLNAFLGKLVDDHTVKRPSPSRSAEQAGEEVADEEDSGKVLLEAQKSIPAIRKAYRQLQSGIPEREKIRPKLTKRQTRVVREERRVERVKKIQQIRSQFPPSMLKPGSDPSRRFSGADRLDRPRRDPAPAEKTVQKGWGSGFDDLVRAQARTEKGVTGGIVQL